MPLHHIDTLSHFSRDDFEFWLKVLGGFGVLLAVLLTWWTHAQRATFEMIDKLYSLCHVLVNHALATWQLAHLFYIGEKEYESVKERIRDRVAGDEKLCSELIVKEKLYAIHTFIVYEQIFYQWKNTSWLLFRRRKFLKAMLSYFADRLLQNKRLVFFLQDEKQRSLHMELDSKEYIDERIKGKPVDAEGPFVPCYQAIRSQAGQQQRDVAHAKPNLID
jgi:hypothetical protein